MTEYQITYAVELYKDNGQHPEFCGLTFQADKDRSKYDGLQKLLQDKGWFVWSVQPHIRSQKLGLVAIMTPAGDEDDPNVSSICVHFGFKVTSYTAPDTNAVTIHQDELEEIKRLAQRINNLAGDDPSYSLGYAQGLANSILSIIKNATSKAVPGKQDSK